LTYLSSTFFPYTTLFRSFNVGEYALPILAVGCFLLFFFSNQKVNAIGQVVFGFGALFFGLTLMSNGMAPLRSLEAFHELTIRMRDRKSTRLNSSHVSISY